MHGRAKAKARLLLMASARHLFEHHDLFTQEQKLRAWEQLQRAAIAAKVVGITQEEINRICDGQAKALE